MMTVEQTRAAAHDGFMRGFRAALAGRPRPRTQRMGQAYLRGFEAGEGALLLGNHAAARYALAMAESLGSLTAEPAWSRER